MTHLMLDRVDAATMKQEIAICLGVEESAVTSDAWMIGDLGMT